MIPKDNEIYGNLDYEIFKYLVEINLVKPSSLLNVIANYEIENILYYLILLEQFVCFTQEAYYLV